MKPSICVVTGSRAEYGLLAPLLQKLSRAPDTDLRLVVTGSHLSGAFGDTLRDIEDSGLTIHKRIPIPLDGDSKAAVAKATGAALGAFADYFNEDRPDLLVLLGDRYEIFACAAGASLLGIPIAHIHGGESTVGAVDEFLRHSITKMSLLHFTACEQYRRRVIQLGEAPERVFNVGALGLENCLTLPLMSRPELAESLEFPLETAPYCVVTFHPVTLESDTAETQLQALIGAMDAFPDRSYIITKANADAGGRAINRLWDQAQKSRGNWLVVSALGEGRYLSALRHAEMVIGNSSSGIIAAPALRIPTVNIGDRQRGRMMAESVICCEPTPKQIVKAMEKARAPAFKAICATVRSPFGDGHASRRIMDVILKFAANGPHDMKKTFYDIEVTK